MIIWEANWLLQTRGGNGEYGEVTSASNCTDYQSRRLDIRYKVKGEKGTNLVHTTGGTAVAISRALIAILENGQQADGSGNRARIAAAVRRQGAERGQSVAGREMYNTIGLSTFLVNETRLAAIIVLDDKLGRWSNSLNDR